MTPKPTIGSISEGTLDPEDLVREFSYELERISNLPQHTKLAEDARDSEPHSYTELEFVYELIGAMNACCPPYTFFGAHPDDGANFGFWPDFEALDEYVMIGDILKVNDRSEILANDKRDVMLVNDHGNVTLAIWEPHGPRGLLQLNEIWSCV